MQAKPPSTAPLAAVDMGSNSFRVEIGEMLHGRYRRIDYLKETVRLGGGLDASGMLTEEAVRRGLQCLDHFATRLAGIPPQRVRAVATQTLREARNRDAFLKRAQAVLGHPIEVISGREEARLIFAGVAHLQPSRQPRLVIDIGGRSTEMILGAGRVPQVAESFAVGSVSLSLRHFGDGRITEEAFRAAQIAAGAEFEEGLEAFARARWVEALGSSGTAGAVSHVLAAAKLSDGTITQKALRTLMRHCIDAGHTDRIDLPGLRDDRKPVLPGGLAILYTLCTHFGIDALRPAKGALRQGVMIELHDRLHPSPDGANADMRNASVRELQRRFGVDLLQALRVRQVAHTLARELQPAADDESLRELGWASDLHELGMSVSHHDHHRHSAYLISNADAPGFSQSEQRQLGTLLLGQRGGLRKIESELEDEGFAWRLLALRLAVIACHARSETPARTFGALRAASTAVLRFPDGWAEKNPRTVYLLQEEAAAWQKAGPLQLVVPG